MKIENNKVPTPEPVFSNSDFSDQDLKEDDNISDDTYDGYNLNADPNSELAKTLMETDSYINRIQLALENKYLRKYRIKKKDGSSEMSVKPEQIPNTLPLANNMGISQIMGRIKSVVHHALALGSINKEIYSLFLARFIKDFGRSIISHRKTWGIKPEDIRDIRRIVTDGITIFITRPIGNMERAGLTKYAGKEEPAESRGFINDSIDKFKKKKQGW